MSKAVGVLALLLFGCRAAESRVDKALTLPEPEVRASVPPPSAYADWLRAQREAAEKDPRNVRERRRLAGMLLGEGDSPGLKEALSPLDPEDPFRLEAGRIQAPKPPAIKIARAELCRTVAGFRRYVPYGDPKLKPGGVALVYVEFESFALVPWGEYQVLHLRYEWELYDEQGRRLALPAWANVPPQEREDRIEFRGAVSEFHQSFGLPLPRNIQGGCYSIRIAVEDQANKKRDEARIPIEIVFE